MTFSPAASVITTTAPRGPELVAVEPAFQPPYALGLRSVMFVVNNLDDTVALALTQGGSLIGEIVQYENKYCLCYMRGPAGIILALSEELF
ncbi:MAG TPA: hypothetical protein VGO43_08195 [Pyrinomonadaceae bacterium]|nr:hypothetical protein [Pyrinomonadaceae bacterium]